MIDRADLEVELILLKQAIAIISDATEEPCCRTMAGELREIEGRLSRVVEAMEQAMEGGD